MDIAIKGHRIRGNEIIELLEMLGGINWPYSKYFADEPTLVYYINDHGYISADEINDSSRCTIYTLEEFFEAHPFKVGDEVVIRGNNYETYIITKMRWVNEVKVVEYTLQDSYGVSSRRLASEITLCNREMLLDWVEEEKGKRLIAHKDYEIKQENNSFYLVKKKSQYPISYLDCCRIIGAKHDRHYYYTKKDKEQDFPNEIPILDQLDHLRMLIICRNAYWKIAGKELGLDKPWKPDFTKKDVTYGLHTLKNEVVKIDSVVSVNLILTFPNAKIREEFYNNFKKLIESCKNFL